PPALPAVVARRPPVLRLREHRLARVDRLDPELRARLLHEDLAGLQRRRLLEDAAGRAAEAFGLAGDADQPLRLVVVRRDVVVRDRPVPAEAIEVLRL